ncbi:hypothetical protein ACIBJF_47625 [Streptomyces sp. NPDC050743]|uniref:hypothetical protein n=1 Tax=Streptomyces sp. NPDC050743 TaxID=3365634 RepID=UPI0037B788D3
MPLIEKPSESDQCCRLPISAVKSTGPVSKPQIIPRISHAPEESLANSATVVAVESATWAKSSTGNCS